MILLTLKWLTILATTLVARRLQDRGISQAVCRVALLLWSNSYFLVDISQQECLCSLINDKSHDVLHVAWKAPAQGRGDGVAVQMKLGSK